MDIPKTMRAAIIAKLNQPLIIDKVALPEKLEAGQVLVKVYYSGICGSQIGEIDGVKGKDPYLPHLLGHEGSGKVIKTGQGVKHVVPGDHVVMHWRKGAGIDAVTPVYQWHNKRLNAGSVTTFNEYAIVSENRLTAISKEFDLELAQLFGCAVTTGLGVVTNNARLKIGESIVVLGAGGVGLNVIQGASLVSAFPIVAVDLYDAKLELAKKFGATHLINSKQSDIRKEIKNIIESHGPDVVVENTGNTDLITLAYEITNSKGRIILVGVPGKKDLINIHTLPLHFGKILTGSHGGNSNPTVDIPRYLNLYKTGKLKLNELITDRFALHDINTAIDKMRNGRIAGRCLIEIVQD